MLEQWVEHLVKVGVPVNEIGMYDGDRSRKHGLLRAGKRDEQAHQHAASSAATLSTKAVDL